MNVRDENDRRVAAWEALEPRLLLSDGPVLQGLSFSPGEILTGQITSLTATFDQALDPAGVHGDTVRLRAAGDDGVLDTADDLLLAAQSLTLGVGDTQVEMQFAEALDDGTYRLELLGLQELLYAANHKSAGLIGFNVSTGRSFAPTDETLPAIADLAMGDGVLYLLSTGWWDGVAGNHLIYSLDLATGSVSSPDFVTLATTSNTAAGDNLDYDPDSGLLYVSGYVPYDNVVSFDPAAGEQGWVSIDGVPASFGTTLWAADKLYILGNSSSSTTALYVWDPATGTTEFVTTVTLPSGAWSGAEATEAYRASDALAWDAENNILYAASSGTNQLVAVDLDSRTQLAALTINGSVKIHDMHFADGRLYIHSHVDDETSLFLHWAPATGDVVSAGMVMPDGWQIDTAGAYALAYGSLAGLQSATGHEFDGDGDGRAGGTFEGVFSIDATAPHVSATTPADGRGADVIEQIVIEFSEAVDPASVGSLTLEAAGEDGEFGTGDDTSTPLDSYALSDNNTKLTYDTGGALANGTYRYTIPASVTDVAGNPLVGGAVTVGFRVAAAPRITAVSVPDGGLINDSTPAIDITFDQPMDPTTLTTRPR